MTKMKSKKMNKSTIAVILMAIAMVAMMAFGGTYAYFSAKAEASSGNVTTARIHLTKNAVATIKNTTAVSGTELLQAESDIVVTVDNTTDTWVVVAFSVSVDGVAASKNKTGSATAEGQLAAEEFALIITEGTGWTKLKATKTAGEDTETLALYAQKVTANADDKALEVCTSIQFIANTEYNVPQEGAATGGDIMDKTITVSVESRAIQALNYDSAILSAQALWTGYTVA